MSNKKISKREAERLLANPDLLGQIEQVKRLQEITRQPTIDKPDVWIINDSSSSFSSSAANLK